MCGTEEDGKHGFPDWRCQKGVHGGLTVRPTGCRKDAYTVSTCRDLHFEPDEKHVAPVLSRTSCVEEPFSGPRALGRVYSVAYKYYYTYRCLRSALHCHRPCVAHVSTHSSLYRALPFPRRLNHTTTCQDNAIEYTKRCDRNSPRRTAKNRYRGHVVKLEPPSTNLVTYQFDQFEWSGCPCV